MINWHTKTMRRFNGVSNDTLCYINLDCKRAIAAMPDNPKAGQYMDEIHYAGMELKLRGARYIAPNQSL